MKSTNSELVVIGGGAAGLMAAGLAAERGIKTVIVEKNQLTGRKLGITGKGRCNVTNDSTPAQVIANVPTNGKFLFSCLNNFTPRDVMAFFENLGVPLKTERGARVFPESDKAADIVNALRRYCRQNGVNIINGTVKKVLTNNGSVTSVLTDDCELSASYVILATGGMSYPATGSTGDGYKIAGALGHNIIEPKPSLVPLTAAGDICSQMQGFSLKNISLRVFDLSGKQIYEDFGEMLFTHFGVSGPLILSASSHMRDFKNNRYSIKIDLKPALDEKKLDARILRDFSKFSNRDFANALDELAGRSMIPVLIKLSGIPPETKVNSITREQRRRLVELFKAFPVEITGPRPISEAIITSGGIDVREINPRTMESKLIKGLYFAGEVIDVDAYTGGYNLQIAWSTAHAAAMGIPCP
ncbi:MAG: NAD(P)/FAD-dependent oxidoreductase [Oscillospiraceae bacterium]